MNEKTINDKSETTSEQSEQEKYHPPVKVITKSKLLGCSIILIIIAVVALVTNDNVRDIVNSYLKKATPITKTINKPNILDGENKQIHNEVSNDKTSDIENDNDIAIGSLNKTIQTPSSLKKHVVDVNNSESILEQSTGINQHDLEQKIVRYISEVQTPVPNLIVPEIGNGAADDTNEKRLAKIRDDAAKLEQSKKIARIIKAEADKAMRLARLSMGNKSKIKEVFNECEDATILHAIQLEKNPKNIRNNNVSAYWKAINNTDKQVAITLRQDNKNLAVVFIPSKSVYKSRIPATFFKFSVKATDDQCIKWMENSGVVTSLPLREDRIGNSKKESTRYYTNAIFETEIDLNNSGISAQTKLAGYASKEK